ncbi:MAG: cation-transporting P-type ATPase [Candidatus Thiodiazotropha sp. (ex Ctena orbiculata)]|nr:cation-transporting P-type ATPase [Candidatus Thiodiazotropha taylori]
MHEAVPGRLRIHVPVLYRNRKLCTLFERSLAEYDAVISVQAKPLTANLVIHFSTTMNRQWVVGLIVKTLKKQGFDACQEQPFTPNTRPGKRPTRTDDRPNPDPKTLSGYAEREKRLWHAIPLEELVSTLGSNQDQGLDAVEVEKRLDRYGLNALDDQVARSDLSILVEQFNSLPVGLLGFSALVSAATGGVVDAAVILGVVGINAVIGFVTEREADRTIAALTKVTVRSCQVVREGHEAAVPTETVVPGDVLILNPGSYVAADARLLVCNHLSVDEASLTGESLPVSKDAEQLGDRDTPLADRQNMVYMGTLVTGGSGLAMVVGTSTATQLGEIQQLVTTTKAPDTPLERQLDDMGTYLAILSGLVCVGVFGVGILRGQPWLQMLKSSVSLAVAAVPEGLPAVATSTLAIGIREMRKRQVAVRELKAVETVGTVQVICLDKTGTLTLNHMSVVEVLAGGETYQFTEGEFLKQGTGIQPQMHQHLRQLLKIINLCSDVDLRSGVDELLFDGSPTETALVEAAYSGGIDVVMQRQNYPRIETRYRAEDRPFMSTLHAAKGEAGRHLLAVKGSPREVLARCNRWMADSKSEDLNEASREHILQANDRMAGEALRVLGVAYAWVDGDLAMHTRNLIWLGLVGLADPIRTGMNELIKQYHQAGIETMMITGDQSATAYSIGKQLGLSNGQPLQIMDSSNLERLQPDLLAGLVKKVHVFSRVSPAHKLRIVQALQQSGRVVAMTGDGINDGPALKAAEIGVAMGRGGTDVARSVADVVLEDDNLQTMVVAVCQGRSIYGNIRKTIHFLLSTNFTEIEVMLAGVALGLGQPLNPMQLLWINLISDIFPGLALSMEMPDPGIMAQGPRDPTEPIIRNRDLAHMGLESAVITAGAISSYIYALNRYGPGQQSSSVVFNTLTLGQLLHAISCRSRNHGIFSPVARDPNPYLNWALSGSMVAQLLISILPQARKLLGTSPLGLVDILVVMAGAVLPLLVNEQIKELEFRKERDFMPPGKSEATTRRTQR